MLIDIDPEKIAFEYYSPDKYAHCERVVTLINENALYAIQSSIPKAENFSPEKIYGDLRIVALFHDLYEDTNIKHIFDFDIETALNLLTHDKEHLSYQEYCQIIRDNAIKNYGGALAYWVKLADIKDHLTQTATLTDKLKEKYIIGLAVLL